MSQSKSAFFRQSGWMMFATSVGGAMFYAVHTVAQRMPKAEYGVFTTLLQIVNLMGIPAIGLQSVFAQQAAAAITDVQQRQLAGTVKGVLRASFVLWLALAALVFIWQREILMGLKISHPTALWLTVFIGLTSLWLPILLGLLQGRQDFLWMGGASLLNAAGRFASVTVILWLMIGYTVHGASMRGGMETAAIWLWLLGSHSAGAMMAAVLGVLIGLWVGFWRNAAILRTPTAPFGWQPWLRRVVPLTLGLGATLFMLSADMIVVQHFFLKNETGFYAAAGMIGRALVFFTIPLTAVMFPKIVQSVARSEGSDALRQALGATALLGGLAAIGCTVFPSLPLKIVYDKTFLVVTPLVPWFAWCMLPLTLANVLVNNLLARDRFGVVPWLVIIALGYGAALWQFHSSFKMVVQTLGVFSLLLLAVAGGFTWKRKND